MNNTFSKVNSENDREVRLGEGCRAHFVLFCYYIQGFERVGIGGVISCDLLIEIILPRD